MAGKEKVDPEIVAVMEGLLGAVEMLAVVGVKTQFLNDQIRHLKRRIEKLKARDG